MHAMAHRGCTNTMRVCTESYLWEKKPVMAPWNQTCLAFGLALYQLKYPTPTAARLTTTLSEVPGKCSVGPPHDFRKAKGKTNLIHRAFKSQRLELRNNECSCLQCIPERINNNKN